ncbi:hypothetical protein ABZ916_39430 [Streptomyces sp. NPDC046853]|uniref:hypothetical protein n=1 Tax=Streptomyces sp. NPDC046853 TaxID=3154920 RepID=UPI0033CF7C26
MTVIDAAYYCYLVGATAADFVIAVGPGAVLVGGCWTARWGYRRIRDHIADRRHASDEPDPAAAIHLAIELAQMAALGDAIDSAPLIPTQHGHDQQALNTCEAIYQLPAREGENQ